jgi:fructuronate reductase
VTRLSHSALGTLADRKGLVVPSYDVRDLRVGIVHLGVGAFHRAHQAVYTEDCLGSGNGSGDWGICAYTQRSDAAAAALAPQDGLYTLIERDAQAAMPRIVGSLREVRSAISDPIHIPARIADPAIHIVALTVTEKGYRLDRTGRLDATDPLTAEDIARFHDDSHRPATVAAQLATALELRRRQDSGPLTIVSCDNLPGNGPTLCAAVHDFCRLVPGGDELSEWIEANAAFPATMVDRIVPAATPADHAEARNLTGLEDRATVVCEHYRRWVIEDHFFTPRPSWESAGATLTRDVGPYEAVKLRMLNATHSLIAYTGALAGHPTIAEALQDPAIAHAATELMATDAAPTLRSPAQLDLTDYQRSVLERFANPALGHSTCQVAADGSAKLPIRLFPTIEERLDSGAEPFWATLAVAAWMVFVTRRTDRRGRPLAVQDPLAKGLEPLAGLPHPTGLVDAFLARRDIFPPGLQDNATFRRLLIHHTQRLLASS